MKIIITASIFFLILLWGTLSHQVVLARSENKSIATENKEKVTIAYNGSPKVWLNPVYPNPVVRVSKLDMFWLFESLTSQTTLKVYTVYGVEVDDLTRDMRNSLIGNKATVELRAEKYIAGVYLLVASVEGFIMSQFMLITG